MSRARWTGHDLIPILNPDRLLRMLGRQAPADEMVPFSGHHLPVLVEDLKTRTEPRRVADGPDDLHPCAFHRYCDPRDAWIGGGTVDDRIGPGTATADPC